MGNASTLPKTAPVDATPQPALTGSRQATAIFAVLSAMALVVLDAGIANNALPSLGGALQAPASDVILVVTGYQAGLLMALLPSGALGERFGHRRVFTSGVMVFAVASGLCAASPTLPWLVAARLLQGFGGGAIMALGVALLRASVPAGRFGSAVGWNALVVALASATAPSLGAGILALASWRAIFIATAPLSAIALLAAVALPMGLRTAARVDIPSVGLCAVAFGVLILAAEIATHDLHLAVSLLVVGLLTSWSLVRRERSKANPLLPLDLLGAKAFRVSVMASVLCFAGQAMGLLALPFLLQREAGHSPLEAGLAITVWPLSVAVTAVVAGRLSDRVSTAWLCAYGGLCLSIGLAGAATWPSTVPLAWLLASLATSGVGFGLFQTPNNRNLFLAAPAHRSGAAGGMQGVARVTGQTFGSAAAGLLFSLSIAGSAPRTALVIASALTLSAGLISLRRVPANEGRGAS